MEENKKDITKMTKQEILRQQFELLAEASENVGYEELQELTNAMISIYDRL